MKKNLLVIGVISLAALSFAACGSKKAKAAEYPELEISELMASNHATLKDSSGSYSDWIELYNRSEDAVDLSGLYLSSEADGGNLFEMPAGEIQAGERLVVFASGRGEEADPEVLTDSKKAKKLAKEKAKQAKKDKKKKKKEESAEEEQTTEIHTSFKLPKEGGRVVLLYKDNHEISSLRYTEAESDYSTLQDGTVTRFSTPGYSNDDAGYRSFQGTIRMPEGLVINEAMNTNASYAPHDEDEYSDWVELYNNSGSAIDLSEYSLSDDDAEPDKCTLPSRTLEPHAYTVIHCDKDKEKYEDFVTGFSVSSGETLYLSKGTTVIDRLPMNEIPYDVSYGRDEQAGGYAFFETASPGSSNSGGVAMIAAEPAASSPEGVYNNSSGMSISLKGEGTVYYTTDGSEPDESSDVYSSPITVDETTVIRAKSVAQGKIDSPTMTASYIVNENHTLPVLSLSTARENLFDEETGIYVEGNHENYYQDWEKPANLTMFDESGTVLFNADCGLKMYGAGSRADCEKKSMRVNFRSKYGLSKLEADLFGNGVTKFKSLIMRGGEDTPATIFRNEAFTTLAEDTAMLTQSNRYCVLYVDGEYFGIFCLAERFSDYYYAQHFDVDEDDVMVEEAPVSEDSYIGNLIEYAEDHDLSESSNYQYMDEKIDLDSMIDWFVYEAYTHNRDLAGNLRYFYIPDESKVKYAFYDLDWAFYARDERFSILNSDSQYAVMIHALLKNDTFRERFVERTGELLNNQLTDDKILAIIDHYHDLLQPEIERERSRWNEDGSVDADDWESSVQTMRNYVTDGDIKEEMIDSLEEEIDLTSSEAAIIRG